MAVGVSRFSCIFNLPWPILRLKATLWPKKSDLVAMQMSTRPTKRYAIILEMKAIYCVVHLFGVILLKRLSFQTGGRAVVAIKCVEKAKLSSATIENLLTEIGVLKKMKHPNIVEMIDFQWDDK